MKTCIINITPPTKLVGRQNLTIYIVLTGSIFSISSIRYVPEHPLRKKAASFRIFDHGHDSLFSEASKQSGFYLGGHNFQV